VDFNQRLAVMGVNQHYPLPANELIGAHVGGAMRRSSGSTSSRT
jgi:hypothetical protein